MILPFISYFYFCFCLIYGFETVYFFSLDCVLSNVFGSTYFLVVPSMSSVWCNREWSLFLGCFLRVSCLKTVAFYVIMHVKFLFFTLKILSYWIKYIRFVWSWDCLYFLNRHLTVWFQVYLTTFIKGIRVMCSKTNF